VTPLELNLVMFGALILLLLTGAPLYAVIGGVGIVTAVWVEGFGALPMFAMRVWELMVAYSLVAVPLFIFMANVLQRSGIVEELFGAVFQWSGAVRGSIAVATVITGLILAAMMGVVGASVITLGLLSLPAMLERGYNKHLAVGTVCAAGALGILVPPSIMPIFYSSATQVSVIDLFAGSILPGLLLAAGFGLYILVLAFLKPACAPSITEEEKIPGWWRKVAMAKNLFFPALIIACVLGTILAGVASPTEAAGVGALAVMLVLLFRRKLTFQVVRESLYSTISATGMALWITFASTCFVGVYAMGGGHEVAGSLVEMLPGGKWGALLFVQLVYVLLGMFIDWIGICLLVVPIFSPLLAGMGFDPVWLGVLFMINMQLSFLSPPFGYSLFFVKGVSPPEVRMQDIWRGALPFLGIQFAALALCIGFPEIVMYLPRLLQ
jgi:tripartite ATP-independent transporter DctM subunit